MAIYRFRLKPGKRMLHVIRTGRLRLVYPNGRIRNIGQGVNVWWLRVKVAKVGGYLALEL